MVGHRWWARYTHISLVVSGWELMRWGAQVTSGVIISHSQEDREKLTWLALHRHVLGDNKLPAGVSGWTQRLSIQLESSGMAPEPSPHGETWMVFSHAHTYALHRLCLAGSLSHRWDIKPGPVPNDGSWDPSASSKEQGKGQAPVLGEVGLAHYHHALDLAPGDGIPYLSLSCTSPRPRPRSASQDALTKFARPSLVVY